VVLRSKSRFVINGVFNHIFEDQLFRLEKQCIFIVEALSERVYIFNLNRGRLSVVVEVGLISQAIFCWESLLVFIVFLA